MTRQTLQEKADDEAQQIIDKATLEAELERDKAEYYANGGEQPVCAPHKVYTVPILKKDKSFQKNISRILVNKERQKPNM